MNKVYVAGGTSYILASKTVERNLYQGKAEAPSNVIWLNAVKRSGDVPPANHKAWRDLMRLFIEINATPHEDYDDSWLTDLRSGSSERINRFYESEDW